MDLPFIWSMLIATAVMLYVLLDGMDLGIGMLTGLAKDDDERNLMTATIEPVWDGNETWLILGGGGLFAAFPLAYAIILPAVYVPIIVMLLALIFRGVAFEFRWRSQRRFSARAWDMSFICGSVVAALMQGIILGTLLQGIEIDGRAYGGGWWDWLTPFTLVVGLGVVAGYALMGACWLNWKLEGAVQQRVKKAAQLSGLLSLGFIALVSALTPTLEAAYWMRWLSFPQILFVVPVPLLTGLIGYVLARSLYKGGHDWLPMLMVVLLFLLCFVGLGISIWPYIIPTESRSGRPQAPTRASFSCLSAPSCWCRSSWLIPALPIGCSAASSTPKTDITDVEETGLVRGALAGRRAHRCERRLSVAAGALVGGRCCPGRASSDQARQVLGPDGRALFLSGRLYPKPEF